MTKIFIAAFFTAGVLLSNIGVTYADNLHFGSTGPAQGYCPDDSHSQWHDLQHCGN